MQVDKFDSQVFWADLNADMYFIYIYNLVKLGEIDKYRF